MITKEQKQFMEESLEEVEDFRIDFYKRNGLWSEAMQAMFEKFYRKSKEL